LVIPYFGADSLYPQTYASVTWK